MQSVAPESNRTSSSYIASLTDGLCNTSSSPIGGSTNFHRSSTFPSLRGADCSATVACNVRLCATEAYDLDLAASLNVTFLPPAFADDFFRLELIPFFSGVFFACGFASELWACVTSDPCCLTLSVERAVLFNSYIFFLSSCDVRGHSYKVCPVLLHP